MAVQTLTREPPGRGDKNKLKESLNTAGCLFLVAIGEGFLFVLPGYLALVAIPPELGIRHSWMPFLQEVPLA